MVRVLNAPPPKSYKLSRSDLAVAGHEQRMDEECDQLLIDIRRIEPEGEPFVSFGKLFDDDQAQQYYEALVGTLKCAKKRGYITFKGQMLLKGMHDDVQISIVEGGGKPNKKTPSSIQTLSLGAGSQSSGAALSATEPSPATLKSLTPSTLRSMQKTPGSASSSTFSFNNYAKGISTATPPSLADIAKRAAETRAAKSSAKTTTTATPKVITNVESTPETKVDDKKKQEKAHSESKLSMRSSLIKSTSFSSGRKPPKPPRSFYYSPKSPSKKQLKKQQMMISRLKTSQPLVAASSDSEVNEPEQEDECYYGVGGASDSECDQKVLKSPRRLVLPQVFLATQQQQEEKEEKNETTAEEPKPKEIAPPSPWRIKHPSARYSGRRWPKVPSLDAAPIPTTPTILSTTKPTSSASTGDPSKKDQASTSSSLLQDENRKPQQQPVSTPVGPVASTIKTMTSTSSSATKSTTPSSAPRFTRKAPIKSKSLLQPKVQPLMVSPTPSSSSSTIKKNSPVPLARRSISMASKSSGQRVHEATAMIDDEVTTLLKDIRRVGSNPGEPNVTFGELFDDEIVQDTYEALVGTLRSAKRRGLITFKGQMLLKGMHDSVVISIVGADESNPASAAPAAAPSVTGSTVLAANIESDSNKSDTKSRTGDEAAK